MGFRLSDEAREYFRSIDQHSSTGKFNTTWDQYYLCFMAGVIERRLGEPPEADPFIEKFTVDYRDQRYELLASLVSAEIDRKGLPWEDKDGIRDLMMHLLDSSTPTNLSDDGLEMMNRYAEGGFSLIRERIPKPRDLDEFLVAYTTNFSSI